MGANNEELLCKTLKERDREKAAGSHDRRWLTEERSSLQHRSEEPLRTQMLPAESF